MTITTPCEVETIPPECAGPAAGEEPDAGAPCRVERRSDSQTWLIRGESETPVHIRPCFPWTAPTRHLSLRDHEEAELHLVGDLTELDDDSRKAVEIALAESGFILEIEKVLEMIDEFEIRNWRVLTRQGERKFQTKRDDWPREIPGGGVIFRDVAGDLFLVRDPEALDEKTLEIIEGFVD